ncbi:putative dolichyl-p-man:man c -pp-dolichyl-alpha- 6-mannosyltransferase [Lasius niger]|uniref:Putative dolichyl-p-man:man c-pp-dolichyl-alpha-6-mannosyltransferase n=1 Tax=Lasius niger TaxID=67767 RepID=A0A0J7N4Z2_LASNI|nr:putative dolichyl-p-man:man c -pp-dolichyl-alpha- 6-mannosyltransferase [Lasius niger]
MDNIENVDFNMSHEVKTIEPIVHDIVESSEEFGRPEKTNEQNLSDIKEIKETNNNTEEEERFNNLVDDNATSMENTTTWKIEDTNKLSPNSKDGIEQNLDSLKNFESVPNIHDAKLDEKIKTKIEEGKIVKGRPKNDLNLRQDTQGTKKTVKQIIQEKIQEDKQKKETNDERKHIDLVKRGAIVTEWPKKKILKEELKDQIFTDKDSALTDQDQKVVKEHAKDDKQRFIKAKDTTLKTDKIKIIKPINLGKITENEDLNKEKIVDATIKKITKTQDSVDTELPIIEREIVEKKGKEDIKASKPINVRESIKNIINQFKEFEKDFIYDNIDSMTSTNDISHANRIESDSHIIKTDSITDHSMKTEDQVVVKDVRESFKEILEQFKHI